MTSPAEEGIKGAREDARRYKKAKVIKLILDQMAMGDFNGSICDLIDNYGDELIELTNCHKESENLASIILNLYQFIK